VRRRLVAAAPDDAPFARCVKAASAISTNPEIERAHRAPARDFAEYGLKSRNGLALAALGIDITPLLERTRAAWPFVRGSTAHLVRPSLGAPEAVHPIAPAAPGVGHGLPVARGLAKNVWRTPEAIWLSIGNGAAQNVYFSADSGLTFRPARSAPGAEERAGRCVGKDLKHAFSVSSTEDGSLLVTTSSPDHPADTQLASRGEHKLLALACDDDAVVMAARLQGAETSLVALCAVGKPCAPLALPNIAPFSPLTAENFDIARISGATVLAVETRGIVRVISTRDDGASWTPPTVAFDSAEYPNLRVDVPTPTRLISLGSRLLLYGAATKSSQSYALLASDDQGASFRSLGNPPAVPADGSRLAATRPE
jgi:hypothetical protein